MMKPSCALLVSSLLLATLAVAGASSSSSLGKHLALVLGRKGRGLGQSSGYHHQHQSKHLQQPEESAMEVKKSREGEGKVRWTLPDQGEGKVRWTLPDQGEGAEAGLIYSADYSGVAMHVGSPPTAQPKHRHPEP